MKKPEAQQPVWLSSPILLMDCDDVPVPCGRVDMSLYSSFTWLDGEPVLWYPDRKFFLLGRIIDRRRLNRAVFP